MCVMSMVSDHELNKWTNPGYYQTPILVQNTDTKKLEIQIESLIKQIEELRKEFLDFKHLAKKAIEYDKKNDEPECEVEDKVRIIKEVAKHLGIDVSDIWPDEINTTAK